MKNPRDDPGANQLGHRYDITTDLKRTKKSPRRNQPSRAERKIIVDTSYHACKLKARRLT